jgi:hypothetical protein
LRASAAHPFVRLATLLAWAWLALWMSTGAALAGEASGREPDGAEVAACPEDEASAETADATAEPLALEVDVDERIEGDDAEGSPQARPGRTWPVVASWQANVAKGLAATSARVRAVWRERGAPEARGPPQG